MALLKFGAIVTSGSGSLGGHTIQNSKGGIQLRTKPIPKLTRTNSQATIRQFNSVLQNGWRDLTDAQRKIWNDFAGPVQSGHGSWYSINFDNLAAGTDIQHTPWGPDQQPYGPELIQNGTFNDASFWTLVGSWSIAGGTANYLDTAINRMQTPAVTLVGIPYKVEYDISNTVGNGQMSFRTPGNLSLFVAPNNGYFPHVNGHYNRTVVGARDSVTAGLWGAVAGNTFSLDNLSIKQIL